MDDDTNTLKSKSTKHLKPIHSNSTPTLTREDKAFIWELFEFCQFVGVAGGI